MNHDAGEHNGEKANTVTKRNLRKNLEREGLKEVVCHLDPYTLKLLNDYCLTLGYNDPSESRARKAKTYSQALTQLILEKLGKKAQDMPKTRKGLELFRLRAIVKEITENGGMTDEAAAKHMTDRGHLPPKFVLNNTKPTRSERVCSGLMKPDTI